MPIFPSQMQSDLEKMPASFSVIISKGTLDSIYPALILATTAAAMDKKVELFFTFYGLQGLLKSTKGLKVTPLANPAMIIKSPWGPQWLQNKNLNSVLPAIFWALPGMTSLATLGFKKQMTKHGQLTYDELRDLCVELGVRMTACQMTVDLLGYKPEDFIDGVEFAGAATYFAMTPQIQALYI